MLKSKPEESPDKKGAESSSLSLTSIAAKPTPKIEEPKPEAAKPAPAAVDKPVETAQSRLISGKKETPAAEPPKTEAKPVDARTRLIAGKASGGEQLTALSTAVSTDNAAAKKFEERKTASLGGRFQMGLVDNLKGQAEGITEIFYGKEDALAELTGTATGQKTNSDHMLVNLTKTTLNVGGVVKDLAADTIGVGDGKTKDAIGKAVTKSYTDFVNGSLADKMEFAGQGTGFLSTLFIGGGTTAKGASNLATDVKVMKSLLQAESKTAALTEAATGMRALKTAENVAAHLAPAATDDVAKLAATTAKTTVGPSRLATAWEGLTTKASEISRSLANTFALPGMEPALVGAGGGTLKVGGSHSAALVSTERAVARTTTGITDGTASLLGRNTKPFVRTAGAAEDVFGVTGRKVEAATSTKLGGSLVEDVSKGKSTVAHVAEAGPKKVEVPVAHVDPPAVTAKPVEIKPIEGKAPIGEVRPVEPKATVIKEKPPVAAETKVVPPAGETKVVPPAGETKVVPPAAAETKVVPPAGETKVVPPAAAETKIVPPAAETKVVPPAAAETKIVPPAGETKVVPPAAAETKIVPPAAETKVVPPAGAETKVVTPAGDAAKVDAAAAKAKPVEVPATAGDAAATKAKPVEVLPADGAALDAAKVKPTVIEVPPSATAIEQVTKTIATAGDDLSAAATRLSETTGKAVKADLDEIARLGKDLGKGDDIATLANINERLATVSRTAGVDVAEDIARTLKPSLQKAEAAALENSALKSAQSIEQRITRMTEGLTGTEAAVIKENLQVVSTGTRQLTGKADDIAQVNQRVEEALRKLETATAKSPLADDVARLARETRELQGTVNASSRLAAVENNSRVLVSTGDDIAREMGKLTPKVGAAAERDAAEITRLAQNLGKGGDDLLTVRSINEHVANLSKTAGKEVADDVAKALKPALQKAETTAIETNTIRSVSKIEQRVTRLSENLAGPEAAAMRKEVASIQQNTQKLIAGTDDAAATASIERSIANLEAQGAKTKYADDIAKLSQDARELQSSVSVSRRLTAIENNSKTLATTGSKLSDDAAKLAADPLKVAAKGDLDEIARLGQNLGKGGDDVAAVTKINERLANISKTVGTEAADDIARALKPTLQKVEATTAENAALRSAASLEQRIARVAETVTGPEAAAIRQNLNALQQSTRGFVNSADNVAAHSEDVNRALQTLERSGAKTNVADDIAKLSRETRDMQVSVNVSRRATAAENTARTLANDGKALGDEVTKLIAGPGRAAKADLDEISKLSNNLGKTGDDLATIRQINDRVANITKTAGAEADEITRALTPKIQKAEQSALEANRLNAIDKAAVTVEKESRNLSNAARDLALVSEKVTPEGRILQQELKAIQRAADELPTSVTPGTDATRLRTMATAVEKADAKLAATAKTVDAAAGDLSALKVLESQTGRVEKAATTLRGTVAQVQDDLAAGTRAIKPGTEESVRRALTTIEENTASVQSKLGTTAKVDREVREIRNAISALEDAGQKPLAQQLGRQFRELDNANTVRSFEVTSHQNPTTFTSIGYRQNLIAKTIDQVDRDARAINAWGNLSGKLDVIGDMQANLQMLRYVAKNDARLLAYVEDTQMMVSRLELTALAKGSTAVERSWMQNLVALAEGGNQQAINRLFVNGLKSDGWTMRSMANAPQTLTGRLGLSGAGRLLLRPEFWGVAGRTIGDATLTGAGLTMLYANYKYHSQLMLKAIEAQMAPAAPGVGTNEILRDMRDDQKKAIDAKAAESQKEIKDAYKRYVEDGERKADLDFTPAVSYISRQVNLSKADEGIARLYGISTDDPNAHEKVQDLIQTGKLRHWSALGIAPTVVEEQAKPNIPVAKSIRIKGPDGTSSDPTNRPKTAITSFSFTRAMELTNQIKLMTSAPDVRSANGKSGTMTGGTATGPSLSQNLRTMVNYNSLKTENGTNKSVSRKEGTEEGGVDGAGSAVPAVPQGPQLGGLAAATVDPTNGAAMSAPMTSAAAVPLTANTVTVGASGNSSNVYVDNSFVADDSREAV